MNPPNKLPLLQASMRLLASQLDARDRVAIVVYAGAAGLVLQPTPGSDRGTILAAIDRLRAGGSTAGSEGIQLAYRVASESFIEGGINRVVLATDGDFNVGISSRGGLEDLIERKRDSGIYLTVLGFGMGNLKDATMELLADKGNGNYAYIDSHKEAEKVLVRELGATLVTIANDVKIQVEFNPENVAAYRLVGYENRVLAAEDFNDDKKDAGELGAGHTVTALYEVVPAGVEIDTPPVDALKYQQARSSSPAAEKGELLTVKLRYKEPGRSTSTRIELPLEDDPDGIDNDNVEFSAAVAAFGMLLRDSEYKGDASFDMVLELARASRGEDPHGDRSVFLKLVGTAKSLM
jgi:Ca-activated chloride channel family protein